MAPIGLRRCHCGKAVHVRVVRLRTGTEHGTSHWIEHRDGSPVCMGEYQTTEFKPYPVRRAFMMMVEQWDKDQEEIGEKV